MNPKSVRLRHVLSILSLALLASTTMLVGCFSTENPGAGGDIRTIHDTVIINKVSDSIKNGGWDDFPNKAMPDLKLLVDKVKSFPVPTGFNYVPVAVGGGSKVAAPYAAGCETHADLVSLLISERSLTIVDTLKYYDTSGARMCGQAPGLLRVTHNRYMLNNAGESWEAMEDTVLEISTIPTHHMGCKGRIHLFSGVDFTIESYGLNIKTPLGLPDALIFEGHLSFTWKDPRQVDTVGYRVDMDITKTKPFKESEFFPARGVLPKGEVIMTGPIKHGTVLVGYFDLYSDHGVMIRDWKGAAVTSP